MLTDDDCRAIREAIGQPAMSFARVRAMVRSINAMPDGPVWVVPRESGAFSGQSATVYRRMTAAGAAEVGEG